MTDQVQQFVIDIPQKAVDDLKNRLDVTRLPDELDDVGWEDGAELATIKTYLEHWRTHYNWREHESLINKTFPQYKLSVGQDNLSVHFARLRSSDPNAIPLIIIHGWPGSFYEFHKVFKRLAEPEEEGAQAFHVVAPSLLGFGFSDRPRKKGCGVKKMAEAFDELMGRLGYKTYVAQGADWGYLVARALALNHSEHCVAIHINFPWFSAPTWRSPLEFIKLLAFAYLGAGWVYKPEVAQRLRSAKSVQSVDGSYLVIHRTKPQSLGYALNDSPVGLLAWMLNTFHCWTDGDEFPLTDKDVMDQIITNVCIYWFTETITSSMRLYKETTPNVGNEILGRYIKCPVGIAEFPKECLMTPVDWGKCTMNVQHISRLDRGGHFASLEVPDLFVADVRAFFAKPNVRNLVVE